MEKKIPPPTGKQKWQMVQLEMEVVTGLIQKLVVENATRKLNQDD